MIISNNEMRKCSLIGCCCLSFIVYIVFAWRNQYFGYTISDSFPKPATKEPSEIHFNHKIKIEEWNTFTKGKNFTYYNRLESLGGERLEPLKNFTEVKEIKELCLNTVGCIGFNTQGFLKTALLPFDKWTHLEHQGGLYVLDVDYCDFANYEHKCPSDSYCMSISRGRYRCELKEVVDNIHVVVSVDSKGHKGLLPLLYSLKKHHTKNVHVHIVINAQFTHVNETYVEKNIFCGIKPSKDFQIDTVRFTIPEQIMKLVKGLDRNARYLKSTGNYARFYFPQIFPNLTKIIYLDVDTIVNHDIWKLWKEVVSSDKLLVVAKRPGTSLSYNVKGKIKDPYEARYHEKIYLNVTSFNAGVFGLNLKKWRDKKLIDEVLYWMKDNAKHRYWRLGTQPLMYVVCYNEWENVDRHWNIDRLGELIRVPNTPNAFIIHWSGPYKPWLRNGVHVDLWNKYDHGLCSGNGICLTEVEGAGGICKCRRGFKGDLCENKVT